MGSLSSAICHTLSISFSALPAPYPPQWQCWRITMCCAIKCLLQTGGLHSLMLSDDTHFYHSDAISNMHGFLDRTYCILSRPQCGAQLGSEVWGWKTKKFMWLASIAIFALLQVWNWTHTLWSGPDMQKEAEIRRPCRWIAGEKYCPSPWDLSPWGLLHLPLGSWTHVPSKKPTL